MPTVPATRTVLVQVEAEEAAPLPAAAGISSQTTGMHYPVDLNASQAAAPVWSTPIPQNEPEPELEDIDTQSAQEEWALRCSSIFDPSSTKLLIEREECSIQYLVL